MIESWPRLLARVQELARESETRANDEIALTLTVGEVRALAHAERWTDSMMPYLPTEKGEG